MDTPQQPQHARSCSSDGSTDFIMDVVAKRAQRDIEADAVGERNKVEGSAGKDVAEERQGARTEVSRRRPEEPVKGNVGAFSMGGNSNNDLVVVTEDTLGSVTATVDDTSGVQSTDSSTHRQQECMVNATLVDEEAVVEASKAPEGFQALVQNKRFKHLVVVILLVLLGVIVPVAVLVPKNRAAVVQISTTAFECGTARTKQADYRGTINITETGVSCQPWSSQFPNSHPYDPEDYPDADLSENYCRNPDGDIRPWCFENKTGRSKKSYCRVPFCDSQINGVNNHLCGTLVDVRQADYRGTINQTFSGRDCQRWDSQEPHAHPNSPADAPLAGLEANYCRNPDGEGAAWCYTTDPSVRWEFCNVPLCEVLYFSDSAAESNENIALEGTNTVENSPQTCGSVHLLQRDYRGTINATETGRTCQRWDSQEPHEHYRESQFHDTIENYCRNPDGEPRAWCFTTDPEKRWEYCDVPNCPGSDLKTCGTYDRKQKDYVGSINVTIGGIACQPWADQTPHFHYELPALLPEANLVDNYCRNPTGDERAWCYTSSEDVIWEYCEVPFCTSEEERQKSLVCGSRSERQSDYRGTISVTESGRRCQRWDSDFPHIRHLNPDILNDPAYAAVLQDNYCRNPDRDERAWCYTTDINMRYEYCDVPYCEDIDREEDICSNCTVLECGSREMQQADYRGDINVTVGGIPCQAWTAQEPHQHERTPDEYPEAGLSGNSCRNPDGEPRAWCYTMDKEKRWDFCSVPSCD